MNRIRLLALVAVAAGACTPSAVPSTSSSATDPLGAPDGTFFVVHLLEDPEPFFDVRVQMVQPDGVTHEVVTISDVAPDGWALATPPNDARATVGPTGWLLLHVERNDAVDDADRRTLLFDLRAPTLPSIEIAGHVDPIWGPGGQLAWVDGGLKWVDIVPGQQLQVRAVEVSVAGPWAADGSGWLADRQDEEGNLVDVGVVTLAGAFQPGPVEAFSWTGVDRLYGARGGMLGTANTDGVNLSLVAITERRPDLAPPCQCVEWVQQWSPGDDPGFEDGYWDAAGTGVWVPMSERDGPRRWLSHVVEPTVDAPVADLPPGIRWWIVGISDDDRLVLLQAEGAGDILAVDTASGESAILARQTGEGSGPIFAGWIR